DGIVLTDTFESNEKQCTVDNYFEKNEARLKKQQEEDITVIIGNPPYKVGQTSVNDNSLNIIYESLEKRIEETYSKYSSAKLKKSLNDTYIKAIRWASDRIRDKGVIGFITNAGFIDSQSADGLRKCLNEEFNSIYILNLRGDQKRTSGEQSRKEGGKIFGSGSRTPTAITILVKDGTNDKSIKYYDIGDYLTREQKLEKLKIFEDISSVKWNEIQADSNNDWINQRNDNYNSFKPIYDENIPCNSIFSKQVTGVVPARDRWVVGFDLDTVNSNVDKLITNFNNEVSNLS
ncbi:TPA: helicase, partial [Staphylococcus pseudintermedius]|nr:helicase [Staphylococcus pseudintermedius]